MTNNASLKHTSLINTRNGWHPVSHGEPGSSCSSEHPGSGSKPWSHHAWPRSEPHWRVGTELRGSQGGEVASQEQGRPAWKVLLTMTSKDNLPLRKAWWKSWSRRRWSSWSHVWRSWPRMQRWTWVRSCWPQMQRRSTRSETRRKMTRSDTYETMSRTGRPEEIIHSK